MYIISIHIHDLCNMFMYICLIFQNKEIERNKNLPMSEIYLFLQKHILISYFAYNILIKDRHYQHAFRNCHITE